MTKEKRDIFERLTTDIGCREISDLKFLTWGDRMLLAGLIFHIPVHDASLAAWDDLFTYLTGRQGKHLTAAAAKRALINALNLYDTV